MSQPNAANWPEFVAFFARHLVGIFAQYKDSPDKRGLCTGFFVEFGGRPALVTAGHVLKKYIAEASRLRLELWDFFGFEAQHFKPVPFVFEEDATYWIYSEGGADLGFTWLSNNCRDLLGKNGVVPFTRSKWRSDDTLDDAAVMGFPFSLQRKTTPTSFKAAAAYVKLSIEKPGSDRFSGRVRERNNVDLEGFSGGPILGFWRNGHDVLRYAVIAVQSSQRIIDGERWAFGTPIDHVFSEIERAVAPH